MEWKNQQSLKKQHFYYQYLSLLRGNNLEQTRKKGDNLSEIKQIPKRQSENFFVLFLYIKTLFLQKETSSLLQNHFLISFLFMVKKMSFLFMVQKVTFCLV